MSTESQEKCPVMHGALTSNQSSGTYYALVKRNGRQIRRSLKTRDRKSAARLEEGKDVKRLTFGELSERWKTKEGNYRGLICNRNAQLRLGKCHSLILFVVGYRFNFSIDGVDL